MKRKSSMDINALEQIAKNIEQVSDKDSENLRYHQLLTKCKKKSDWQQALKLLNEMHEKDLNPGRKAYTAAIAACSWASKLEPARELF